MGFLDKLMGKTQIEIAAPVSGEIVPITTVSDPVFAQEMVGKGIAIMPGDGNFYAPCDGTLVSLFPTGHAFAISSDDGAEVLVHIGIDTVKLEGRHFDIKATQGDRVKKGDLIVTVDLDGVKSENYEVVTPVIISNPDKFLSIEKRDGKKTAGEAAILLIKK